MTPGRGPQSAHQELISAFDGFRRILAGFVWASALGSKLAPFQMSCPPIIVRLIHLGSMVAFFRFFFAKTANSI